ncbi:MAG: ParB N-terminal domain-containing protein [Thalassobaculaceae bacterium]
MNALAPEFDTVTDLPLELIDISDRLRRVDPAHVEGLKQSIEAGGLSTPVVVTPVEGERFRLVAGAHRLAAVKLIGATETIPARIVRGGNLQLRLLEIDENLIRHELRPWDRAVFLARRKEIYDALHPEATPGAKGRQVIEKGQTANSAIWAKSFSQDTAERVGLSDRSVRLAVSIVSKIDPSLHDVIAGLPLADNQSELEALAKQGPERQADVVRLLTRDTDPLPRVRDAVAVLENRRITPAAERDKAYQQLLGLWNRSPMAARRLFIHHLRDTGQLPDT